MNELLTPLVKKEALLEPAVCFQSVNMKRGNNDVLIDIDLDVEQGSFLGIIGPNGGGKTTLLHLILGLLKPKSGKIEVFGHHHQSARLKRQIGYVPQNQWVSAYFPATVYDVVLMGAYGASGIGLPVRSKYKEHAKLLLAEVGLDDVMHKPISHLSGGQQQRAYIARALVTWPKLLLLDEPLRGLDASSQNRFFEMLVELKHQYELTVIMVSHHIHNLTRFSERIACLNKTIHWHDRSELVNEAVLSHTYKCELDDIFLVKHLQEDPGEPPFKAPSEKTSHSHLR